MANRKSIIDQLKQLRASGRDIEVDLRATTEKLQDVLSQFFGSKFDTSKEADGVRAPLNSNLISLLLDRLTIDTTFRLYRQSSLVRRIVNDQQFWRRLIVGVLP